ncbi:hypothetical protein EJ07DRAFT_129713 [Lizonia empirigonia]|nr:hypothetical protein EJ07DRAFT_129713 [Lizonia empirigonia]
MCKSIKYWFSCQHGFRLRASQCGGTKHKTVRGGLIVACKSESYLNIVIPIVCGPCQYQAFEEGWKQKLLVAETFLQKLEEDFPGVQEVVALVEQLTDEFNTASWNTRSLFPHFPKESPIRVTLGQFEKRPSPLRRDVLPEDIPEPSDTTHPEHPDYEYDWDYIASTDPLHPVDTNYSYPLDDVDPSWMLDHLSLEEFEEPSGEVDFDPRVTTPCSDTKASKPARTLYDRWRRHISGTKDVDRIKFNTDLLLLSRCEIRDAEGPSGRLVPDPPLLQDGGAKNGWFS